MNSSRGLIDLIMRLGGKPTGNYHRDMAQAKRLMNKKIK